MTTATPRPAPRPALRSALRSAPATPRGRRLRAPLASAGAVALAALALHVRDPHRHLSWGLCPSATLGLACPGCGGLRAVHDLTHLRLGDAASSNLALVILLPLAAVLWSWWVLGAWRGAVRPVPGGARRVALVAGGAALLAFTVLRNTGAGAWLAP